MAKERVRTRVLEGGHNIEQDVIERRYTRGIINLFDIYFDIVNAVMIFDNSGGNHRLIAKKNGHNILNIIEIEGFNKLKEIYENCKK